MSFDDELIRVMSYNIRYDNEDDGENRWENRKELVASMVRFHRADIVGFQEVLNNQHNDLLKLLPEYGCIGVGRDDGKEKGEYAEIIYRSDKFKPIDYGYFWLSETPDVPGTLGWDAGCVRMVTWIKFTHISSNKVFYHFNTHFDNVGMKSQEQSSILLLNRIKSIAGCEPVIVTGDFNCTEDSNVYEILTGKKLYKDISNGEHLNDAKYISKYKHHGPSTSYNDDFDPMKAEGKIDFIFIKNNVEVIHHGILSDEFDFKYSSDHMPVAADVILR